MIVVSGSITKFFSNDRVWSIDQLIEFLKDQLIDLFLIFFFGRFWRKCGITPHGLFCHSKTLIYSFHSCLSMRKTCPNSGFLWSLFSRFAVNVDQKSSKYFYCSVSESAYFLGLKFTEEHKIIASMFFVWNKNWECRQVFNKWKHWIRED